MNDTIVGVVLGWALMAIWNLVERRHRKEEMEALWAEEERRRKSDRTREHYEKELKIMKDATDMIMEARAKLGWSTWEEVDWKTRAGWLREATVMVWRACVVGISPVDEELREAFNELAGIWDRWLRAVDVGTGKAREGVKEEEFTQLQSQLLWGAAKVRRRITRLLEEV